MFLYLAGVPAGCHGDRLVPADLWLVARHLLTGRFIMQNEPQLNANHDDAVYTHLMIELDEHSL